MTICIRHGWYQNDGTVPADCPSCMLEMRPFEEYICPSCAAKDLEITRLSAIVAREVNDQLYVANKIDGIIALEELYDALAALNAAKEPQLPCPHARPSWKQCPHCLGVNDIKEGKG